MVGYYRDLEFDVEVDADGNIKLFSFEGLKRSGGAKWTTHESLGGMERAECTGLSLEEMSFSILLRSDAGISAREKIDQLFRYKNDRKAGMFVLGSYSVGFGAYWVVTSVSAAYEKILRGGEILSARVDVQLKQYR